MTSVKLLMTLSHAGIEMCDLHVSGREPMQSFTELLLLPHPHNGEGG